MRPQLSSLRWMRPSAPPRLTKAPKSARLLTTPSQTVFSSSVWSSLFFLFAAPFADGDAFGEDEAIAAAVEVDDLHAQFGVHEFHPAVIGFAIGKLLGLAFAAELAGGYEAADLPDFDDDATAIEAADGAGEHILRFQQLFGVFPVAFGTGTGDAEEEVAVTVFAHDVDGDLVADGHVLEVTFKAVDLPAGDEPFGLIADVDEQFAGAFVDNDAMADVAGLRLVNVGIVEFLQEQGHRMVIRRRTCVHLLCQEICFRFDYCCCLLV